MITNYNVHLVIIWEHLILHMFNCKVKTFINIEISLSDILVDLHKGSKVNTVIYNPEIRRRPIASIKCHISASWNGDFIPKVNTSAILTSELRVRLYKKNHQNICTNGKAISPLVVLIYINCFISRHDCITIFFDALNKGS